MENKSTVIVTGASGYIASHVIKQLLEEGYAVRGTLRTLSCGELLKENLSKYIDVSDLTFVKADLLKDDNWGAAMQGGDFLIHMASPVPMKEPDDENNLIKPARDGAIRALKAAQGAGIKRIVLTSSIAAISSGLNVHRKYNEEDWSDLDNLNGSMLAYTKSKILAEKAAWEFVKGTDIALTTIHPSVVIGPLIGSRHSSSTEVIRRIIQGKDPGWPKLGFSFVDVRDVANAHVKALQLSEARGNRFICSNKYLWMSEIALILKKYLKPRGRKIKTWELPDFMVKLVALFDPTVKMLLPELGRKSEFDTSKIRTQLSWSPRSIEKSICDTAQSLIEHNIL